MSERAEDGVPRTCVVTGGSGFVGQRLVEMLVERGAERVVSFDRAPRPADASSDPRIEYVQGDITRSDDVRAAFEGTECCFHIAALVGPYHEEHAYERVNYGGTLNVIEACRHHGVRKLVMSSSPSTRFPYPDPNVRGLSEDDLTRINGGDYSPQFHATYARTKAMGERAALSACDDELLTVAIAPHQVYGPRDALFLPSLLAAARSGKLRVFGPGDNRVSFTHVDNYCHGLILGAQALRPGSPVLGRFYIVTDGDPQNLWDAIDRAVTGIGLPSLRTRRALPTGLMMLAARGSMAMGRIVSLVTGTPYPHVMKRLKLTTFSVKMLVIDRYFDISRAREELGYAPIIPFEQGWSDTIRWFAERPA